MEPCAPIYILPWVFAMACKWRECVEVVWPEDGAIISPMFLIAKKNKLEEMSLIVRTVMGKGFGEITARMYHLTANANVSNGLDPGMKIKWLGWDFVRNNDIDKLKMQLQKIIFEKNPDISY
jgi:ABC-type Fe3+ transport system substrate-binding protein